MVEGFFIPLEVQRGLFWYQIPAEVRRETSMCERVKYNQESFHCVPYFLSWQNDQGGGFFVKVSGVYRLAAIGIFSKKDSITGGIRFVKQKFNV